jgi:hypothetical protein
MFSTRVFWKTPFDFHCIATDPAFTWFDFGVGRNNARDYDSTWPKLPAVDGNGNVCD